MPACVLAALLAMATAAGEALAPTLEAEPSAEGWVTWWLYSPVQKDAAADAKPPPGAREGDAVPGAAGKWALHIAPGRFVDFRPLLAGHSGTLWASARIDSQTGGKRRLKGGTYCALRVYNDGQLVLNKPQPVAPYPDEAQAEIELPKGPSELTVAVNTRQGFCGFQLSLAASRDQGGQAQKVAGDRIIVPTATGKEPDAAAAALRAITFGASAMFAQPGDNVALAAGMGGSIPLGLGPLSGRILGPDGKPVRGTSPLLPPAEPDGKAKDGELQGELPDRSATDLVGRGMWRALYTVGQDAGISQVLSLEVKAGGKALGVKKLELYSLKGLSAASLALEAEIRERAAKAGRPLPCAALAAEKLRLFLSKIETGEERVGNDLGATLLGLVSSAKQYAEAEEQGRDPLEGATGYIERAYTSRLDGAPQPYFAMVPSTFKPGAQERLPLVVFLHGYVPSYDKHRWWTEMQEFNVHFEKQNAFLAIPFGRSNTDFQSCGEVDVLDVIAEMKRLYPIDGDRVYLYGYSMGGMAVYHLAAHYPDLFAAVIVMAGRADSPLQNKQPLGRFHPYKQWLIHVDNPISLCENFLNIPLRIYHGRDDFIINVKEAQRMEARFKELGCDAKLHVMPGDHFFGFDVMTTDQPLKWLLEQKRQSAPARDRMKTYSLKYAKHGPVAVTAATGKLMPIEVEWSLKDGVAEVTRVSENVLEYSLNGKVVKPLAGKGLRKTPGCCGPLREAICTPFIAVYGTSGSADANARNRKNAEQFAKEWFDFTRSRTAIKADKEVTDAEKQTRNLLLFGEEQNNLLHAAAAKDLPFAVKDGQLTIGGRTMPLAGKGFMYIYPSPFRGPPAEPAVVICAGSWYGREVGPNHKFDLLPDFIFYDDQIDQDQTSANRFICAGFFNGEWKLDEATMWWAEP